MKHYVGVVLAFVLMLGGAVVATAQKANPASDFKYDLNSEGTGVIIQKYKGTATEVVIPSVIEDFPVVELKGEAFDGGGDKRAKIVSVVIPDSVVELGKNVFSSCESLKKVILPKDLDRIPGAFFVGCTALEEITLSDKIQAIGGAAFSRCTSLKTVTIGSGIKGIGNSAFKDCSSLTTFNIGVEEIGGKKNSWDYGKEGYDYDVFNGCSSLSLKARKKIRDSGYTGGF